MAYAVGPGCPVCGYEEPTCYGCWLWWNMTVSAWETRYDR